MDKETFGKFVANSRRELGMTQLALAEQLHVTDKAVSKWERGLCYPDLMLIEKLASVLNLTVEELMACGKRSEGESLDGCGKTQMRSLLQIVNQSQKDQRKKIWMRIGLVTLSIILLTSLIVCVAATNINSSHECTFVGKKVNGDGNFVYMEKDGRLLCLRCPDQQMYDNIEAHKEWEYQIEYSWNYFTCRGTLKSCQENDALYLGTPMDTLGNIITIGSLLGTSSVNMSTEYVYPDPEREGNYLYTYCFFYGEGFHIVTVDNCRSVAWADYDEDDVTELFVLTKYAQEPYMLYDMEKGAVTSVFVDEVPADVLEQLKMGTFD